MKAITTAIISLLMFFIDKKFDRVKQLQRYPTIQRNRLACNKGRFIGG
jgi:hypothetical protein